MRRLAPLLLTAALLLGGLASAPAQAAGGCAGTATKADVTCGPYADHGITMSNGFNTYVSTNCWAHPGCGYRLAAPAASAHSAEPWSVTATETAGNTGVRSYPDIQQLTNNWCGAGWGGCASPGDTPLSGLRLLRGSYAETMPHNAATDAQAAWDLWLTGNGGGANEVMVWVDNVNRGDGGAARAGGATVAGQPWTLYQYGGGELIWSLGGPGTFARQARGTVHLLALLRWLQAHGFEGPGSRLAQADFGWEICSTGGRAERFAVSSYTLTGVPA
jgi:hypothetical protein